MSAIDVAPPVAPSLGRVRNREAAVAKFGGVRVDNIATTLASDFRDIPMSESDPRRAATRASSRVTAEGYFVDQVLVHLRTLPPGTAGSLKIVTLTFTPRTP